MSNTSHNSPKESKPLDKRLKSYITGFVLSLVFTLIPYYLVVHQSVKGDVLLATIIGFAVLQLFIQLVFFLHLGREPRQRWNLVFLMNTFGIILVVVGASIWIMSHLSHNMTEMDVTNKISSDEAIYQVNGSQTGTCAEGAGVEHMVVLKNNTATPNHTDAKVCDKLMIMNEDHAVREIAFGEHEHHIEYAGQGEESLGPGQSMFVKLTELGTYKFHDHIQDKISGDFTVKQ